MRTTARPSRLPGPAVALVLATAAAALAAPGDLDPGFSKDGKQEFGFRGGDEVLEDVVVTPDGKIVVAGVTTDIGEDFYREAAVARLNPGGSLDRAFAGDGRADFNWGDDTEEGATGVAVQPDGRVLVTGDGGFEVARLTDAGFDDSFAGDGREITDLPGLTVERADAVGVLGDGRVVVAGTAKDAANATVWVVARYSSGGTLDPSFSGDGFDTRPLASTGKVTELELQADGRILVAGADNSRTAVARFLADGGLDPSFSGDGVVTADGIEATGMDLDEGGRVLVSALDARGFAALRFTSGGDPDSAFAGDGSALVEFKHDARASDITAVPGGAVALAGEAQHTANSDETDFAVAQLDASGALDNSFSGDGRVTTDFFCDVEDGARAIAAQADGRLVAVGTCQFTLVRGQYTDGHSAMVRYLASGSGHDADADGLSDSNDRCPNAAGPHKARGCAEVRREFIRVRFDKGKIHGELDSSGVDCELAERVKLMRVRRGKDDVVDKAKPARAAFAFKVKDDSGTYKVITGSHVEPAAGICEKASASVRT